MDIPFIGSFPADREAKNFIDDHGISNNFPAVSFDTFKRLRKSLICRQLFNIFMKFAGLN